LRVLSGENPPDYLQKSRENWNARCFLNAQERAVVFRASVAMTKPIFLITGGRDAGHVELRTKSGFASDFASRRPYPRPVLGIYVKPA